MLPQWALSYIKVLDKDTRQTLHVCNIYRSTQNRRMLAKRKFGTWSICSLCMACKHHTWYAVIICLVDKIYLELPELSSILLVASTLSTTSAATKSNHFHIQVLDDEASVFQAHHQPRGAVCS
ncbi:hypothetical protein ABBQ32_004842 [Trebouxia sp. C0010 RCD-2024]